MKTMSDLIFLQGGRKPPGLYATFCFHALAPAATFRSKDISFSSPDHYANQNTTAPCLASNCKSAHPSLPVLVAPHPKSEKDAEYFEPAPLIEAVWVESGVPPSSSGAACVLAPWHFGALAPLAPLRLGTLAPLAPWLPWALAPWRPGRTRVHPAP